MHLQVFSTHLQCSVCMVPDASPFGLPVSISATLRFQQVNPGLLTLFQVVVYFTAPMYTRLVCLWGSRAHAHPTGLCTMLCF